MVNLYLVIQVRIMIVNFSIKNRTLIFLFLVSLVLLFTSLQFMYSSMDIADSEVISPEDNRLLQIYGFGFWLSLISSLLILLFLFASFVKVNINRSVEK